MDFTPLSSTPAHVPVLIDTDPIHHLTLTDPVTPIYRGTCGTNGAAARRISPGTVCAGLDGASGNLAGTRL
jgi:hypothetical protein